jgi:peptide deformylase
MDTLVPWLTLNAYPDEILLTSCEEISEVTPKICEFANDMVQTMYSCNAYSLSAPQVGRTIRLFVMDCSDDMTALKHFINPRIIHKSDSQQCLERCLSFVGLEFQVARSASITIEALGLDGKHFTYEATGLEADCIQHEIDHLEGITFLDRVSRQQRRHALRRWEKEKNSYHTTSEI